jgi:cellulose synthase/poly-beta-1,6-N-acetylglucosamine synthase-like glycosyltransferase
MIGIVFWIAVAAIAYTYAGYPLVLFTVSRLRRAPKEPDPFTPSLTVVIAAFNEAAVIAEKLTQTLALGYPAERLQVIVAADGSDDDTVAIAHGFADRGVLVLHRPERAGKLAAITRAVEHATGDVIVFSDANNSYQAGALHAMAAPFADPSVGVVSGRKMVLDDDGLGYSEGLYWRYESMIKEWETRLGCCVGVNGEITAIRRMLFVAPPAGIINDDSWMARMVMRLGYRIVYAKGAISVERVSASPADEIERRSRMVAGQFQTWGRLGRELPWKRPIVTWQLFSHKLLRPIVPLWMATAAGAGIVSLFLPGGGSGLAAPATLAAPWNWIVFSGQIVFYGLAFAGHRLTGRIGKIAFVPRFLVNANWAALQGLKRHLSGKQTPLWDKVARREDSLVDTQ